jgi:hypothetical protein
MQGSARQLFQRLQGPMEEDTIKAHFEKIIMIGQKQHYGRSQVCDLKYTLVVSVKSDTNWLIEVRSHSLLLLL